MNRPFALHSTTPAAHLAGVIATALVLASPLARADEPSSGVGAPAPDGMQSLTQVERRGDEDHPTAARHRDSGLIPGMLIGPRLTVAVPTPTIGAEAKILRYFGASFDYGYFPKIDIAGVGVSYSMWNVAARVYPFGDTFFIGAVYGHYGVEATATVAQGSGFVRASSNFLGPQIGARWIQPSGFFVGVELAWAFALGYSSEASPDPSGTTQSVKQTADRYLQNGIPIVGLVSVGWLF
jgi:hypothetical protein